MPNTATPKVSIVMPCFNAGPYVEVAVRSVLDQQFSDLELIIVDDGSSDDSVARIQALAASDARIRLECQLNQGAGPARNRALALARGEWLAFLDADDWWSPQFLQAMLNALEQHGATLAYCGWQNIGVPGPRGEPHVPPDHAGTDLEALCFAACPWPIHAVLLPRAEVMQLGGFEPSLSSCMDYDLWLRVATRVRVVRVPEVMAFYRHHGGTQITGNALRIILNHLRVQERYLAANPAFVQRLGHRRLRELSLGRIREQALTHYWARRLHIARPLFHLLARRGYFQLSDWKALLGSLLPESWQRRLLRMPEGDSA